MNIKYSIYQSEDFPILKDDHPRVYQKVYQGEIDSDPQPNASGLPMIVLEAIFALHNQDGRPDAKRIRSLSASDMVALHEDDGSQTFYQVMNIGFSRVVASRMSPMDDSSVKLFPAIGDGVYLSLVPNSRVGRARVAADDVFDISLQEVIDALVQVGRLPVNAGGYGEAELLVRHNGTALVARPTDPDEKDYPGMNLDAVDPHDERIFLANVELPNADYLNQITTRLYNGYAAFESDEPSVLMGTFLRMPEDARRLGEYADGKRELRKILYVDRDICETRTWSGDVSEEHEYEPPANWKKEE